LWDDPPRTLILDFEGQSVSRIIIPMGEFAQSGFGISKERTPTSTTTSEVRRSTYTKWLRQPVLMFGFAKESLTLSSSRRWDSLLLESLGVKALTPAGSIYLPTASQFPLFSIQMKQDEKELTDLVVSLAM